MATNLSQLGLEVDKVEHSDIPTGGTDKVLLYASGSGSDTKLYVKSGANVQKQLGFDIDQFDAKGDASIHQTDDHFIMSDNGTEKKITFSNMEDAIFGNVTGDATIAAGGALTIANDAVEQAMIADDAVGADQLAANAVVNASIASNAAIDLNKIDGGSADNSLSDLAQTDLLYAGDVDDSNEIKKITFSDFEDAIFGNVSGDATIAAGGALTIAAQAVENSMLADDAVGADELAANAVVNASVVDGAIKADKLDLDGSTDIGADLADADLMIVDDGAGGTNRVSALSRVKKYIYSAMSGDATASDAGALTIAANAVEGSMLNANTAGDGLGYASNALKVQVAGAVTIASDKVGLSGSVAGDGLTFSGSANAIGGLSVDIAGTTDIGAALAATDEMLVSDGGNLRRFDVERIGDFVGSGADFDVSSGALSLADDSVDSAEIADGAIDTAHIADDQVTNAKLANIARGSVKVGGASNAPTDLDAKTSGQILVGDGTDVVSVAVSGDVSLAANGAVTIAANAVEGSMLNSNVAGSGLDYGSNELSVDVSDFMSSGANNRILTATGTDAFQGEANLTFDGSTLAVAGAVSGSSTFEAVGAATLGGTLAVSGAVSLASNLLPVTAGGTDLGSASKELGNVYLADDKKIHFGSGQDASIEYDEDGTDQLRIAAPAAGVVIAGTTPSLTIGDADAEDTKLVFDGNAQDFYMGLDDTDDKLKIGLGSAVGTTPNLVLESATRNVGVQGGLQVVGNAIADSGFSGANPAITFDGSQNTTLLGSLVAGGGYGSGGYTLTTGGALSAAGELVVGSSGADNGANFTVHGNGAGEKVQYVAADNTMAFHLDGSTEIMRLGADSTGEFAIEVEQGSNNINKIKASAFVTYSDESLKEDVSTMNTALDTVMSLNGVEFTWKNSGERDFGFIAQDVEKVLPKAVHTAADGIHGVDYSRLTSVLVEAVKAQQVQIEELKAILKK